MLLNSCGILRYPDIADFGTSSSSTGNEASSVAESPELIEFPVEIEEMSSSSVLSGSGSLAERMAWRGIFEIGEEDAPHLLTIFTNYSCDYCKEFMRSMVPRLESDFIASGKLRVRFVIVPLNKYPNSAIEASSLLCAAALDKGWAMHEKMLGSKLRDRKSLSALVKTIGLPAGQFTTCLDSKETKNLLAQQQEFIADRGVTLIPAFLLDDEQKTGLPPYPDLRGWINERLAR